METSNYYKKLKKPIWAPPGRFFGPVWTGLYVIIFVSYSYTVYLYIKDIIPFIVLLPFILNLVFNFSFTPLQFGLKNNWLASIDIVLTVGTLIWAISAIYSYASWVSFVNIPYALWSIFAAILQLTITVVNRKKFNYISN